MKTRFEKDYKAAQQGNGIEIFKNRKRQLDELKKQFKSCKNGFKCQCLSQEIKKLEKEYQKIDDLF